MRYCIFSDVHGNWQAFEAVSKSFKKEKIDKYIYLGDVIGYGAQPHACITGLRLLKPAAVIAGNHEWGVIGLLGIDYFNEYAAQSILWTASVLSKEEIEYLKSFQLFHEDDRFTLVHGSLVKPARFNYIMTPNDADIAIKLARTDLCFVGHSHAAGFYIYNNGCTIYNRNAKIRVGDGNKYLINVGSVGQPRDGDNRSSYVIYDDAKQTIEIKRVEYDIITAQRRILDAGLPAWLASRLAEGR